MSVLSKLSDLIGGSIFKEIKDLAVTYLPPGMSDLEKANFELRLNDQLYRKEIELSQAVDDAARQLDKRIEEQEGTVKDLKQMPYLGKFVIFLRGAQRPTWGYLTIYMDMLWLFGDYEMTHQQELALTIITGLVLGFLFGERAIKNVAPFIAIMREARSVSPIVVDRRE